MGFNIHGYDRSKNMVDAAKAKLIEIGLSEKLVNIDNFEKPKHIKNNSQDCILGLGTFYYTNKFKQTLINQKKKLKKNGRLIFSLRNELFNISTLNDYTSKYLKKIYPISRFSLETQKKFDTLINKTMISGKRRFKNIDDNKVFSLSHNPLTIKSYLKNEIGLSCENILFYHFHALPPKLEEYDKINFRKLSFKMENPYDWRGNLIASSFIVDAKKI
jgi:2-polyprenyl-3-methyl-5-hydroxy-6-metoxy-1,4-benzoquinol methylase